jgi:zinc/manganese transport system permease protein
MFDGFWASEVVRNALLIGAAAALLSGIIGVFTVLRGQSFAGHALADVSSAGGALSLLLGINPMLGFFGLGLLGALGLSRGRRGDGDLAAGILLGAGLGLTALLLYFDITTASTGGAAVAVMFGSMFAIPASVIPLALAVGVAALLVTAVIYRPLLLSTLDADLAAIRGVRLRLTGFLHLGVLALAVALSAMTVGAVLSTALLIGPAACGLLLARRPGMAILLAAGIGLAAVWGGILLAYDSFDWTPGHGWPVSFFIVSLICMFYLVARLANAVRAA